MSTASKRAGNVAARARRRRPGRTASGSSSDGHRTSRPGGGPSDDGPGCGRYGWVKGGRVRSGAVGAAAAPAPRVAFVACGDRELAEDAVQSAWLVAWRKLHSLRDPDRVRPLASLGHRERGPPDRPPAARPGRRDRRRGARRPPRRSVRPASSASTSAAPSPTSRPTIAPCWLCTTASISARTSSRPSVGTSPSPPASVSREPSTVSGRSSAMAEREPYPSELDLAAAFRAYLENAPTDIRDGGPRRQHVGGGPGRDRAALGRILVEHARRAARDHLSLRARESILLPERDRGRSGRARLGRLGRVSKPARRRLGLAVRRLGVGRLRGWRPVASLRRAGPVDHPAARWLDPRCQG